MNKRLPLLLTLLALLVLAASGAYWILQLYKPEQRPLAAAPLATQPAPSPEAAATLFGGQPTVAISSFQLTGVVSAGANSAVILVADGSPPKAVRIGREIAPGVVVAEVHRRYVMLSDSGVMKRVELAPDAGQSSAISQPVPRAMSPQPMMEPQMAPGVVSAPPMMQSAPPNGNPQGMQGQPRDPPPEQDNPGQQGQPQMPQNAQPMNGERPVM
jgi:general secretion pathway protein C